MQDSLPQNDGVYRSSKENDLGGSSETDDMSNIVASIASEVLQKVNTTEADQRMRPINNAQGDCTLSTSTDSPAEAVPVEVINISDSASKETDIASPDNERKEEPASQSFTDAERNKKKEKQSGTLPRGEKESSPPLSSKVLLDIVNGKSQESRIQSTSAESVPEDIILSRNENESDDRINPYGGEKSNGDTNDPENADLTKSMIQLLVGTGGAADLLSEISSFRADEKLDNDEPVRPASFTTEDKDQNGNNGDVMVDINLQNSTTAGASHEEQSSSGKLNLIGSNLRPTDENSKFQPMNDVLLSEQERMAPADEVRQMQVSPPPIEVEVPTDGRDSESPVGPPSTVSNVSTSERESPVEAPALPKLPTIDSSDVLQHETLHGEEDYNQRGSARTQPSETEKDQRMPTVRTSRQSPTHGIPPRSPAAARSASNYQGQIHSQPTDSPVVYHDVMSNAPIPNQGTRPPISRQSSRVQEPSDLLDPPSVSGGAAAINPTTAMDVLTQHLLHNLEGKLVAQQQQQVLQQHQHYALQSAPSSLSGYSTPIGARSAFIPSGTTNGGSGGIAIPTAYVQPYQIPPQTHVVSQNGHHMNGYQSVNQPASVVSEISQAPQNHPPPPLVSGKRSIKLELMEHSRPEMRTGRSYAASARELFKGASSRHRREGSLFTSISKFRHSVEVPRTPLTSNTSEVTPTKKYISRGMITVCWYEGTTTTELQTHVRNSITRKLGRDVDNIRLLDPSSDFSEVVLTPHIPSGSEFVVRFTEAAPVRTVYKYGERAPDSPSAAPSPSPSTLELSKMPSLDLGSAKKKLQPKTSGEPNLSEKSVLNQSASDFKGKNLNNGLSNGTSSTIHEEDLLADSKGERVVFVQASRSQEKKHVVFVIANYFVLFLSFIAIMAELHERAPTWINEQYSQVQACAVDRDTLFECVSNGDVSGLIASFFLWVSKSTSFKRFFLFGFNTRQQLWIVIYESFVTSFCWGLSYIFIRRGLNPDTRTNFLTKYWKDACYGALAGFNASFLKAVMKNLIPREAVEEVFVETQQLGLINILGRMFRHAPTPNAAIIE